uniref:Uncharacterized protein n=1 Tax=Eutreptiella gymnastica TaxID=73025 RepID=A0A7S4LEG2_9EUGL
MAGGSPRACTAAEVSEVCVASRPCCISRPERRGGPSQTNAVLNGSSRTPAGSPPHAAPLYDTLCPDDIFGWRCVSLDDNFRSSALCPQPSECRDPGLDFSGGGMGREGQRAQGLAVTDDVG